ncbi:unnamed protein product [Notodromas monacha]|uniref:LIM zinc-binding domain-containing protein n=1 Tax=Notodromas monacha TaxID=399045 RepID=A0A7R9BSV0_9CRUS|nr:unnamed protein product [Notodromas monacha]CAG0919484.1 unnamed protein product [Notodromas monacha]
MNGSRLPLSLVEDLSRMRLTHAAGDYASDARKVAPVVPPKPRKPAGCQVGCGREYVCVTETAATPPPPPLPPQGKPAAPPTQLLAASSKVVVANCSNGGRFGIAVSRSTASNGTPASLPPDPGSLHKAEPVRMDGYGRQQPPPPPPPTYVDLSSNYTDYSNLASCGASSTYSNYSNYADYENLNSAASVASCSSFNTDDLPPPEPPVPAMYATTCGAMSSCYEPASSGHACLLRGGHLHHGLPNGYAELRRVTPVVVPPPPPYPAAATACSVVSSACGGVYHGGLCGGRPPDPQNAYDGLGSRAGSRCSGHGSVHSGSTGYGVLQSAHYGSGAVQANGHSSLNRNAYDGLGSRAGSRCSGHGSVHSGSTGYGVLQSAHYGSGAVQANGHSSLNRVNDTGSNPSLSSTSSNNKKTEVDALTDLLVQSMKSSSDPDFFGLSIVVNDTGSNPSLSSTSSNNKKTEVDALTDLLVQSMKSSSDPDFFGLCQKCGEKVVGEGNGCTAMDNLYHIKCFTCFNCGLQLEGKPFYAVDAQPHCDECYLETLEKCSVCRKPILDRILRATGKPYHPKCFCCVVCGSGLDGIPFTVDAHNRIHCIEDFHKKFAPRCSVCRDPIMPEPGEEETVRVVALDRSFHVKCYRCEDCGLALSSEAEGRGCYPLDGHVLCKNCNAKRVRTLTEITVTASVQPIQRTGYVTFLYPEKSSFDGEEDNSFEATETSISLISGNDEDNSFEATETSISLISGNDGSSLTLRFYDERVTMIPESVRCVRSANIDGMKCERFMFHMAGSREIQIVDYEDAMKETIAAAAEREGCLGGHTAIELVSCRTCNSVLLDASAAGPRIAIETPFLAVEWRAAASSFFCHPTHGGGGDTHRDEPVAGPGRLIAFPFKLRTDGDACTETVGGDGAVCPKCKALVGLGEDLFLDAVKLSFDDDDGGGGGGETGLKSTFERLVWAIVKALPGRVEPLTCVLVPVDRDSVENSVDAGDGEVLTLKVIPGRLSVFQATRDISPRSAICVESEFSPGFRLLWHCGGLEDDDGVKLHAPVAPVVALARCGFDAILKELKALCRAQGVDWRSEGFSLITVPI